MSAGIDIQTESKIVALMARGDSYKQIMEQVDVNINTLTKIKKRNQDNLTLIKQKSLELEQSNAQAIKDKANKLLSNKLDAAMNNQALLLKAKQDWLDDVITFKEYEVLLRQHKDISVTELVTVSREMHSQSQDHNDDKAPQKDLKALTEAIKNGDTVQLNQMIFNPK